MQQGSGKTVMCQGRIVWLQGDLFKGRQKVDFNTKQPKFNAAGEPMMEYGFGLAVPKSALGQNGPGQPGEIWAAIYEEAFTLFPSRQIPPAFAMKFKDGDGIDDKGVPFSQRKGYAGHLVFACTTSLPIKFFKWESVNVQINEGIKCGDYVNVQLNIKAHPAVGQAKGGLYINPLAVQFLGFGEEIINTPSGDQIFGTLAPPMPQGASATPIAPPGMLVPQAPTGMPAPQGAPPVASTPNWGILPPAHQPAVPMSQPSYPGNPVPGFAPNAYPSNAAMPGIPYPGQQR